MSRTGFDAVEGPIGPKCGSGCCREGPGPEHGRTRGLLPRYRGATRSVFAAVAFAVVGLFGAAVADAAALDPAGQGLRDTLTTLVEAAEPGLGRAEAAARVDQVMAGLDADQQATVASALGQLPRLAAMPGMLHAARSDRLSPRTVGTGEDLELFRADLVSLIGRFRDLAVLLDDPTWGDKLGRVEQLFASLPPQYLPRLHERYIAAAPGWKQALLGSNGVVRADAAAKALAGCDYDCGDLDLICQIDEAFCVIGEYATLIGNFVTDFFDDVADVFVEIGKLPAQIEAFFVGLVTDIESALVALVEDALSVIPDSPAEALALLGLDNPDWQGVLAAAPLIDLPCPAIGTDVPGIGTMGSIQAEYTCKRGVDWASHMIYDIVPDDIYDVPVKAIAAAVYYPINYFCLCVEAQSNIAFFGDQAIHRALVDARLNAVMSTRSSQLSVDGLNSSLVDLDGDVAVVEAKLDVLEVKLDSLQLSQNQNSDFLALFRELVIRLNIEEHLLERPDDVIVLFQRPEAQGGYLESVRAIVLDTIDMNVAAGERVFRALDNLNAGDDLFAVGDWAAAFDNYRRAYEQAVKR